MNFEAYCLKFNIVNPIKEKFEDFLQEHYPLTDIYNESEQFYIMAFTNFANQYLRQIEITKTIIGYLLDIY